MFLWRTIVSRVAQTSSHRCRRCEETRSFDLLEQKACVTFLGRPVLTLRADYAMRCRHCDATFDITREEGKQLLDADVDHSAYEPHTTRRAPVGGRY